MIEIQQTSVGEMEIYYVRVFVNDKCQLHDPETWVDYCLQYRENTYKQ